MTNHSLEKKPDGTIAITVTVPWADIQTIYKKVVDKAVSQAEIAGFRKGKAPRKLVEEKLDKNSIYEDVIRDLLPGVYNDIVTKEKLKPVISPKIDLKHAEENKNWELIIYTCERPKIILGEYKKHVKDKKGGKTKKIWVPGKNEKEEEKEAKGPTIEEILFWVYESVKATIPQLLIEHEVNRSLSALIDQTKSLGLSVEQYLRSTGKTADSIRKEYEDEARKTLTLEFALEDIADAEGVLVSDDDIDAVIKTAKTEDEKKNLETQRYYLASVLRRQKTLDFLSHL